MTGNFSFVSRLSPNQLYRNREAQRCLARNLVNVHRTCSVLLTRLQRTVNEPQPKMIKINYCWGWCVVDDNQSRFRVSQLLISLLVPLHNVWSGKNHKFHFPWLSLAWGAKSLKFLWRHSWTRPLFNRRQQNRRLLTSLWPYFVMCHRKHNFPLCMNDIPALGDCRLAVDDGRGRQTSASIVARRNFISVFF